MYVAEAKINKRPGGVRRGTTKTQGHALATLAPGKQPVPAKAPATALPRPLVAGILGAKYSGSLSTTLCSPGWFRFAFSSSTVARVAPKTPGPRRSSPRRTGAVEGSGERAISAGQAGGGGEAGLRAA